MSATSNKYPRYQSISSKLSNSLQHLFVLRSTIEMKARSLTKKSGVSPICLREQIVLRSLSKRIRLSSPVFLSRIAKLFSPLTETIIFEVLSNYTAPERDLSQKRFYCYLTSLILLLGVSLSVTKCKPRVDLSISQFCSHSCISRMSPTL